MRGACRAPENGCTVRGPFPSESQVCTPGGFGFLPLEPPSPRFSWKLYQAGTGPLSRPPFPFAFLFMCSCSPFYCLPAGVLVSALVLGSFFLHSPVLASCMQTFALPEVV